VRFAPDVDCLSLATLLAQAVQHAARSEPRLEIDRQTSPNWSSLQRAASLLARHELLRTVDTGERLSLSLSPECALLLEASGRKSSALRLALLAAVTGRDELASRAVLQEISDRVAAER
jgi:hypothetical protein